MLLLTLRRTDGAGSPETRVLATGTLSVGRGTGNDWVLLDPDRHLSKTHCVIAAERGRFVLTDLSTNGLFVNGARQPTARDDQIVLTDGDHIRLGDYTIQFAHADDAIEAPARADPFAEADPLDDVARDGFGPGGFSHPDPPRATVPLADPFDMADEARGHAPDPMLDDLFAGQPPGEEWRGPTAPDTADAPRHAYAAPRAIAPAADIDFDALIGDLSPAASPADPLDVFLDALATPPRAAPPPPLATVPDETPSAGDGTAALRAFLEGAGVPHLSLAAKTPEETLRAAGTLFRIMTEGLREVLMSRAALKSELRVEQTMMRARDNNALKFSATVDEALAALLTPGRPGYKPAPDAAREAFHDIKGHELAVMAGVQTALLALLRRFEPASLEARLQKGMFDAILPGARKARYWEVFCATYADIAREAEDDFQAVFGREFARAYEAQARKTSGAG